MQSVNSTTANSNHEAINHEDVEANRQRSAAAVQHEKASLTDHQQQASTEPVRTRGTLPSRPSALIRAALEDLRKVEALPEIYRVNLDVWHREHRGDAVCEVCLAGASIAQRLGATPGEHRGPEDYDQETTWKLYALNEFRVGNVFDALCYLDRADLWLGADTRAITEYSTSPAGFHRDMQQLAADLEAAGL